jgi:hypothetical protein
MKVQVTVDVTDGQRFGISIQKDGKLGSASREECREWLLARLEAPLSALDEQVANVSRSFQPLNETRLPRIKDQ